MELATALEELRKAKAMILQMGEQAKESMAVKAQLRRARHRVDELEAREIDVEILQGDLTTLRQLVGVHTKQLTELTIIPIGCSREQELRWTQSIKDLRATPHGGTIMSEVRVYDAPSDLVGMQALRAENARLKELLHAFDQANQATREGREG